MNKFVRLLFLVLSLFLALYLEGVMKGAQSLSRARASEVLVVVDQDGQPVPAARIQGGFRTGDGMRDNIPVKGLTEANGEFHVSGSSVDRLSVRVIKEGYYPTDLILDYRERSRVEDKCWQPYGTRRTVVLKRQVNPGRLVVFPRELRDLRIPKRDVWMGFDLELHDWIRPWGRGVHDDVLFCFHEDEKREGVRFSDCLQMSFTNNPFAGAGLPNEKLFATGLYGVVPLLFGL